MTEFPDTHGSLLNELKSPENRVAWEEFVILYRPVIYRMARRRGLQDADAQDAVQNVLLRISRAIADYDQKPGTRFPSLAPESIPKHDFHDTFSSSLDVPSGGTDPGFLVMEEASPTAMMELELITETRREQFLRAATAVRAEVSQETWRAFEMTVVEGVSCEAAAEALGKALGSVYAARSRILRRLRLHVESQERQER